MIELTFLKELMLIKQVHQKCDVCHYWYLLNFSFKFQPNVCNRCQDLLMMPMNLNDIAILTLICTKWIPGDQINIFLVTIFAQKMPERSHSMYSSLLIIENICHHHFSWIGSNIQEIVNLFQFSSGPRGRTIGTKFTVSCQFGQLQGKWWCHMFSNMK